MGILDDIEPPVNLLPLLLSAEYRKWGSTYPGVKVPVPGAFAEEFVRLFGPAIEEAFPSYHVQVSHLEGFAGVMCDGPTRTKLNVPYTHLRKDYFQSEGANRSTDVPVLAASWHLQTGPAPVGLGFFEHLSGISIIDSASRFDEFNAVPKAPFGVSESCPLGLYSGGNGSRAYSDYAELGRVSFVPNRLVVYPGNLLQSPVLDVDDDVSNEEARALVDKLPCDAKEGRLELF